MHCEVLGVAIYLATLAEIPAIKSLLLIALLAYSSFGKATIIVPICTRSKLHFSLGVAQ